MGRRYDGEGDEPNLLQSKQGRGLTWLRYAPAVGVGLGAMTSTGAAEGLTDAVKTGSTGLYRVGKGLYNVGKGYVNSHNQFGNTTANLRQYFRNIYNIGNRSGMSSIQPYLQQVRGNLAGYRFGSGFGVNGTATPKSVYDAVYSALKYARQNYRRPLELIGGTPELRAIWHPIQNALGNWQGAAAGAAGLGTLLGLEKNKRRCLKC